LILLERTADSYAQLEKAFILHPSYKTQYMLLVQLNQYLVQMNYHDPLSLGYLIKASRLINFGIERKIVEDYLTDIVKTVLVEEKDTDGFKYIYDYLIQYISDEDMKNGFTYLYLYESGRMEFNDARYGKALEFFEPAYEIMPGDERTQDMLVRSLAGYSLMVGPGITLQKINAYDSLYSNIIDEGIYVMVKVQTYLTLFGEAFQLKDAETGERYMKEFERLLDEYPEAEVDHLLVGRSFSSAAIYYYGEGRVSRSKEVIEQGLVYAPGNIELKLKLKSFK
jgi:hypothetical protein